MFAGLVHTAVARALAWALIHFLWEGAAIAAMLAAALYLLRPGSARVRYGLASAALGMTIVAFGATFAHLWPRVQPDAGMVIRMSGPRSLGAPAEPSPAAAPSAAPDRLPWIVPLWMAGVLIFYVRTAGYWLAAQRLRRRGTILAPREWQERLRGLAARMRLARPVVLLESSLAETPAVIGFLRPAILVPAGLLMGLPPDQLEAILLHELAHIRRHDYAVNVLQSLVEGLLFYHPAVWWISGMVRAERENCCDDAVVAAVGNARGYAAALAALEQRRSVAEPAMAAKGGNLMRRIRRLIEPEAEHTIVGPVFGAGLLMILVAVGLMAWPGGQAPVQPPISGPAQELRLRAELARPYSKWLDEDVAYIITAEEKAAFQRLTTDEEREQFIEQFWQRRDPTPGTAENEFKEEHYRRVAFANEHFAESIPGWKTHRGMYYIKFGPPDEIEQHMDSRPRFIAWTYHCMQPAPGAQCGEATLVFTDVDGSGQFTLPRHNEAQAIIMGTPPGSPRVEVSGDVASVTFNIPSFGGPTTVYLRISTLGGSTIETLRGPATPPYYTMSWRMVPGTYRIQGYVQRPGESVFALYPRGEQFTIAAPAPQQAAVGERRVDAQIQTTPAQIAAAGQAASRVQEALRRTGYVTSAFTEGAVPGAQTARGRIYLQYGPPDSIDVQGLRQVWFYRRIEGIGEYITVEFVKVGGSWVMERPSEHGARPGSFLMGPKIIPK